MKRGTRFFIVLATGVLTFGTLMASLGPKTFENNLHRHSCRHHYEYEQHCDHKEGVAPNTATQKDIDSI
ncbi:MAG: hypothetical protein WCP57_08790 [Bacteroidota bacterium]